MCLLLGQRGFYHIFVRVLQYLVDGVIKVLHCDHRMAKQSKKSPRKKLVNCPVYPSDYSPFKAGCELVGIPYSVAFGQAAKLCLGQHCPQMLKEGGK